MDMMLVYDVTDHTGEKTRHLAVNKESAVQAHLVHLDLLFLSGEIKVSDGTPLSEFKNNRDTICWKPNCCLMAATDYSKPARFDA